MPGSTCLRHTTTPMVRLHAYRNSLSPAWRGALFYLGFWGITGVYEPFLNVYFARLGLGGQEIGVLSAFFPLMTLVAAPMLSALADRRAWRTSLLGGLLAGLTVTLALFWLPRTFAGLIPLMALLAFFRAPTGPIADSLIARMSVRYRLNYGNLRMWGSLSFSLIAIACGVLWQRVGFVPMFLASGILFLPVILSAFILDEGPVVERQGRQPLTQIGQDAGLVAILAATFLVGAGLQAMFIFGGIYMDHLGGTESQVGLLFGIAAFCELPTMQYSDAIVRRLGGSRALLLAYGLLGCSFAIYVVAWVPGALLLASVFSGLGFGLFFVSTVRLIDERAPEGWSSTAQAIMNASAFGLAPLIASLAGGWIYDVLGPPTLFVAGGAAVGMAALVLVLAEIAGWFRPDNSPG